MADNTKQTLIFTYGTLKRGFPNHNLIQDLIFHDDAVYRGTYITHQAYPLVLGPHGIPYLINLPSSGGGNGVKGELYSVSTQGLARLDELEGTSRGHYERLPIQVVREEDEMDDRNDVVLVDAMAYFAHRSFGEKMWEKSGRVGLSEYSESDCNEYVRIENRPKAASGILDDITLFLSDS